MMKNYFILFLLISSFLYSQEESEKENPFEDWKQWHVEFGIGANKAMNAFIGERSAFQGGSSFYGTNDISGVHLSLAGRYMFSDKFGLRLRGAYNKINSGDDSVRDWESEVIQANLEAVLNLGRVLDFKSFSDNFGLLAYGGVGVGFFTNNNFPGTDHLPGLILGVTPRYRLSKNLSLNLDFTGIINFSQQNNWDGSILAENKAVDGLMLNASLGLSYAFGKGENGSIDWYYVDNSKEKKALEDKFKNLEEKIDEVKKSVDDKNDNLKNYIVNNFYTKEQVNELMPSIENFGFGNVFFDFDSEEPEASSINQISSLVDYLQNNPNQNIELVGYTDVLGSEAYNDGLSLRRAKAVNDILVNAGIDQSRIEFNGDGVNPNYNEKRDDFNRMLARRVMVIFK